MADIPLAVLDLVPLADGDGPGDAVRNAADLAARSEELGLARYWVAEHHLNPGVLGISPALALSLAAGTTTTIRLGSAGVQMGHRTPLSVVEEFGLLDARFPGRLDLGLGRSLGRRPPKPVGGDDGTDGAPADRSDAAKRERAVARAAYAGHDVDHRTEEGVLLPRRFDPTRMVTSSTLRAGMALMQQPGAYTPAYAEQVDDILALLGGTYVSDKGVEVHARPGEGADIEVWVLGSSGGVSAEVAGEHGLRFAASYHHSPSTVMDAVTAYRDAFRPSTELAEPYVSVSADVVVADDDATAQRLAGGCGLWVRSIRRGEGAIPFPTPEDAAAHVWTADDLALVQDRVDTQVVGSPATAADRLEQLAKATGADELAITTITHDHADRVRSYELLAAEWHRRHGPST